MSEEKLKELKKLLLELERDYSPWSEEYDSINAALSVVCYRIGKVKDEGITYEIEHGNRIY